MSAARPPRKRASRNDATPRAQTAPRTGAARTRATMSDFARAVCRFARRIPRGRVTSYAAVAAGIGRPRAARAVGSALQALPDDVEIPWWRVINGRGTISPGGGLHRARLQRALLEAEGVRFDRAGRIDLARFGWRLKRDPD